MKGRSSARASGRASQRRCDSSPEAAERSSWSPGRAAASARRKRASKRRVRPGGVIARKTKRRAPIAGAGTARPVSSVSSRRAAATTTSGAGASAGACKAQPPGAGVVKIARTRRGMVRRIDAAAGEDELRRHEHRPCPALAHQHLGAVRTGPRQDHRGGGADRSSDIRGGSEAVHPLGPLQGDQPALQARQEIQRQGRRSRSRSSTAMNSGSGS